MMVLIAKRKALVQWFLLLYFELLTFVTKMLTDLFKLTKSCLNIQFELQRKTQSWIK